MELEARDEPKKKNILNPTRYTLNQTSLEGTLNPRPGTLFWGVLSLQVEGFGAGGWGFIEARRLPGIRGQVLCLQRS